MPVGYVPDTFGHIGQLPQLLRGFGMDVAVFRRGLSDEPTELLWSAPDGSTVLACYLRDGYDNAAWLPKDPREFLETVQRLRESLTPHATTPNLLLMNGTDHMDPMPELPALIRYANQHLQDAQLVHSTLPQYIEAVKRSLGLGPESGIESLAEGRLRAVKGELRSPKRHHLLQGVLSTRIWIKQRNAACQTLLEAWAEPFAAFCRLAPMPNSPTPNHRYLQLAWRYLLQNHPHDSICGCSVDQVHREMVTRFDWVEQIGEEVTRQSLEAIAGQVQTEDPDALAAVVVFNPLTGPRTDVVGLRLQLPAGVKGITVVDEGGQPVPFQVRSFQEGDLVASMELDTLALAQAMNVMVAGKVFDMVIRDLRLRREGDLVHLDVTLSHEGQPDLDGLERARETIRHLIEAEGVTRFLVRAQTAPTVELSMVAQDVPSFGYKTFWIREATDRQIAQTSEVSEDFGSLGPYSLENEFYVVEVDPADGTLTLTDKDTGLVLRGLNRFVDGGDRGDEYNYEPPPDDHLVSSPVAPPTIEWVEQGPARQTLRASLLYRLPESLTPDRAGRGNRLVDVPIVSEISLSPGVRRVDVRTTVDNRARDHRLQVHFPTPILADQAWAEGHWDVIPRPVRPEEAAADWAEVPAPTQPQRAFVDLSDGQVDKRSRGPQPNRVSTADERERLSVGLLLANKGLPEYEVIPGPDGHTLALTLLRCVGWLSRGDLTARRGPAGNALETPEAQCPGTYAFEYALMPHSGDWRAAFREAHAFNAPLRGVVVEPGAGRLPAEASFLQVEPDDLVVTAVKPAEEGDAILVRCCNLGPDTVRGRLRLLARPSAAWLARLDETPLEDLPIQPDGGVEVAVRSRQVITVLFEGFDR
jgi:alpha-mannosidase